MASIAEMAANVRKTWLREPLPQRPTVEALYQTLFTEAQHFHNRLSNTGKPWTVGTFTLTIPALPNNTGISDTFRVNVPGDCGKILQLTARQNGQEYLPTVFSPELVNIGDLFANVPIGGVYWYGAAAERIGIYQQYDGNWYGRAIGYSPEARVYDVLYTVGDWISGAGIESSPVLKEHHHLVEARTAFQLLDAASWFNDDEKDEARRRSRLATLVPTIESYEKAFDEYVRSLRTAKVVIVSSGCEY